MNVRIAPRAVRAILIAATLACANAAHATVTVFDASLSGPNEAPPNASPATGTVTVTIDPTAHTAQLSGAFSGLLSNTTVAAIQGPTPSPFIGTAGVITPVPAFAGFPLGVTAGAFSSTLDTLNLASYNPAFVTANGGTAASAEVAFYAAVFGGEAYFNIHTVNAAGGEIRGFLVPREVPEPGAWLMMVVGFGALGVAVRRRRRRLLSPMVTN